MNMYNLYFYFCIIVFLILQYSGSGGKPPHVAVESFSLVVNRNECFGLLGPNGRILNFLLSPFISFSQFNAPFLQVLVRQL